MKLCVRVRERQRDIKRERERERERESGCVSVIVRVCEWEGAEGVSTRVHLLAQVKCG